jgi:hypothetical protein
MSLEDSTKMNVAMAATAKGDKVLRDIISQQASRANMVDLEIVWASAVLASPAIALQDLPAKFAVGIWIQPKPRLLSSYRVHEAFRTSSKNSFFSG